MKELLPPPTRRESFRVRYRETDRNGILKLSSWFDFLQEAAANHATQLGVGLDALSERGLLWVLSRLHLSICRYPAIGSLFRLEPEVRSRNLLHLEKDELAEVMKILRDIETEQTLGKEYFPLAMAAHFVLLTVFLGRCIARHRLPPGKNSSAALSELINRLSEHTEKHWTRPEMARSIGVSESSLTRMFKQSTGYAPNEYLIILRLKKGAMLLLNTDLSIGEIADRTGFSDSNYFCRQFKKHFRIPPRKYRSLRME